ncbi:MAG: TraB/GumN family protein [Clostridia bacterium]|nr:TraB/GumN family protein [Clostridia bacterium]
MLQIRRIACVLLSCVLLIAIAGCRLPSVAPSFPTTTTTAAADADSISPLCWQVTGPSGNTLYLFGTIHIGDERMAAVMSKLQDRLASCDALAVEMDTVAFENSPEAPQIITTVFYESPTYRISDHMPADLYERAVAMLKKAGMYADFYDQFDLAYWSLLLEQAALSLYSDLNSDWGVEDHIITAANKQGIPVLEIESAEEQYHMLDQFSDELNLWLIEDLLDSQDEYGEQTAALYEAWLAGDYEQLCALNGMGDDLSEYSEEEQALLKEYNQKLLDDRNVGMAKAAKRYLEDGKTVFLAVGAAHMLGDAGIVHLLEQEGYAVEQIDI